MSPFIDVEDEVRADFAVPAFQIIATASVFCNMTQHKGVCGGLKSIKKTLKKSIFEVSSNIYVCPNSAYNK